MKKQALLLILFIGLLGLSTKAESITQYARTYMNITNSLGDSPATIQCKSKGVDMGERVVQVSESYKFDFLPNHVTEDTLFYCSVKTHLGVILFDAYREQRDRAGRCDTLCYWEVRNHGVFGFKEHATIPDLTFIWSSS